MTRSKLQFTIFGIFDAQLLLAIYILNESKFGSFTVHKNDLDSIIEFCLRHSPLNPLIPSCKKLFATLPENGRT